MLAYPNAKINIGLNVLEKRPDGFHELETVFFPVPDSDILEIAEAPRVRMFQYGIEYPGAPEDNLCMRAYRLLESDFGIPPVEIHLYKRLAVGAGLGGGSSDAAFTLKMLDEMFSLGLSREQLAEYAARLGSDCPFFIYNRPMLGRGRGEVLSELPENLLEGYDIRVVCPPYFVSTGQAYGGVIPRKVRKERGETVDETPLSSLILRPAEEWKGRIGNDFERHIFAAIPELAAVKEDLYRQGAVYASMSGSGSALFGIFRRE